MLAHVLGYVGIDNQGLSGLELEYDKYLTGENGAIKYYSDAKGNNLKLSEVYVAPQAGINLQLTIDYNIQKSVERELNNVVNTLKKDDIQFDYNCLDIYFLQYICKDTNKNIKLCI